MHLILDLTTRSRANFALSPFVFLVSPAKEIMPEHCCVFNAPFTVSGAFQRTTKQLKN